nr:MAG TPA: hypothetical protein [Bacteriophage sp.]
MLTNRYITNIFLKMDTLCPIKTKKRSYLFCLFLGFIDNSDCLLLDWLRGRLR